MQSEMRISHLSLSRGIWLALLSINTGNKQHIIKSLHRTVDYVALSFISLYDFKIKLAEKHFIHFHSFGIVFGIFHHLGSNK